MKSVEELIGRTRNLGIHLWVSNGTLNFRAPRVAISSELRRELLEHKASIIDALSGPRFERAPEIESILLPEGIAARWKQALHGKIGVCNTNLTHVLQHFTCPVDLPALERSLQQLACKHNALRCRLADDAQGFRLAFDCMPTLETLDLSGYGWAELAAPLLAAAKARVFRPFTVGECLFRAFVFKVPSSEFVVGFVVHHFIVDNWSVRQIPGYWAGEYMRQFRTQPQSQPAHDVLQYSDFLLATENWSRSLNFQRRLEYWKETLRDVVPSCLPPDHVLDRDTKSFHGSLPIDIDVEHVRRLTAFAASLGATLNDVLLAAVALALHDELKLPEIFLRNNWHGRDEPRLFDMVGDTLNPVILRIRVNPQSRLDDVVREVHRVSVDAIANQVPGHRVDEILEMAGAPALVKTNFRLAQNAGLPATERAAALPSSSRVPVWTSERAFSTPRNLHAHDLNLSLAEGAVRGQVAYLEDVYREETIRRFLRAFDRALEC